MWTLTPTTSSIEKKKILLTFERGVCLPLWFYKKVIVYLALSETNSEVAVRRCSAKKVVLKISQNSQENTCVGVCLTWNFTKKETPTQLFYCEFCEIFKNTFFIKHLRWLLLTNLPHQLSLMNVWVCKCNKFFSIFFCLTFALPVYFFEVVFRKLITWVTKYLILDESDWKSLIANWSFNSMFLRKMLNL